ncbi:RagB/SusD family nutrient uptake outer membrane protein [Marinilongibacter aquaticus]|uniref:RagB/SusD family nutrient uptake outer membrane protein n=1 Tax=Marinilongibacter aquaticus TaxID=2975157 RepID=UPI0021BD0F94|nr:RagB/SusD family nutrient uptake outer membrane protein [Marinilongibacter aquaticus]UBM60121.1 RagB/SusD family nutrient uptake outer membrane protein [Marinilongibacter aquaticus]
MRFIKRKILAFALGGLVVAGCNDDFVNTQPLGEVSENAVWNDVALAKAAVTNIYRGLGNGGFDEEMLASYTDEAMFTHPGRDITVVTESRSNPANPGKIKDPFSWPILYRYIRGANVALENLAEPLFDNSNGDAETMRGEALFMRAYYYQQLLRFYGPFPIVDRSYALGEESYDIERGTYEECINFILGDLDEAASLLAGKSMEAGRATEAAALALKSRVLLYAASDLHDVPTAKAKSALLAGYDHPEFIGYTSGDRASRWQKAKSAAKAVLDMVPGNMLNLSEPASQEDAIATYINTSLSRNGGEADLILGRYFISAKREDGARQGLFNGPNGYNNWAGNTPISLLVDDYQMMDGSDFSWDDAEKAANPYENREARFYATFLYDGAQWKPRSSANQSLDPLGQIQTGQYEVVGSDGAKVTHFGLDTRNSTIEDWNGSYTGYYVRKFINPDPDFVDQNTWQDVPWPVIRVTEVLLNYVEACIELGEEAEAKTWLNKVRFRAGLPAIEESGDALRDAYRHERRIELAYEEHRFHDTRRWMIAPSTLGRQPNGISITGTLKPGKSVSVYHYDPESYDYTYKVVPMDVGKENRLWLDKMYFLPIHRDEMNRNASLIQNPGYE